ncbi:MAG TPA: hypothetical protein ENN09_00790 [Planctomycetes bacterium]|nr:hypothetical protein [Planctomycetota bacterium]
MHALMLTLALIAAPAADAPGFEARLKAATGPNQLLQLEKWCLENGLADERTRVREIIGKISLPARPSSDYAAREHARRLRDSAREQVELFLAERTTSVITGLSDIVEWMGGRSYAPLDARQRVLTVAHKLLDPASEQRKALEQAVADLPDAQRSATEAKSLHTQFDAKFKSVMRKFTEQMLTAVGKCITAGEAGYGFDLYRWLLQIDPDNEWARRGLGEQKVDGVWMRPYEVMRWREGLVWDGRFGWVPRQDALRARYERGEVYDLGLKRWGSLDELNALHANADTPWIIESEHFALHTTAELAKAAKYAERLEAFFLQAFRQYDLFFSGTGGTKLIFGVAPSQRRLKVYIYRDREQFVAHAKPPADWAAGFYSGAKKASYFYDSGGRFSTLQHELTHQILAEFAAGRGGHSPWVAEGAATFLENADFENDVLTNGGLERNWRVREYQKNVQSGAQEHPLKYMVDTFSPTGSWNQGEISKNYRGAAAVWFFLMNFDGGRFRGDTVQLLRDDYCSTLRQLDDYYGITPDGLTFLMDRYYRECMIE